MPGHILLRELLKARHSDFRLAIMAIILNLITFTCRDNCNTKAFYERLILISKEIKKEAF